MNPPGSVTPAVWTRGRSTMKYTPATPQSRGFEAPTLRNVESLNSVDAVIFGLFATEPDDLFDVANRPALACEKQPRRRLLRFAPGVIGVFLAERNPGGRCGSERKHRRKNDRIGLWIE